MLQQAVILAGGKGMRLGKIAERIPKALVPVGGRPLLQHLLGWCREQGMGEVVICAGHLADQIERFVASEPVPGLRVSVSIETEPMGTAGALRLVANALQPDFLVLYGDVFVDFDAAPLIATHERERPVAALLTRASDHPWDSHLVDVDGEGWVREFVAVREPGRLYRNVANAAVYVCSRSILNFIPAQGPADFGKDVFPAVLAGGGRLAACGLELPGFVKDMGTPERLAALEAWLEEREWIRQARRERRPIRTVFLDRDGTLNAEDRPVLQPDDLVLLPGVGEAVRSLNEHGFQVIVVTNQAAVARAMCTLADVEAVHQRLRELLAREGARLDAIYFSPYHPETHYPEGVPEFRRASRCRKPDVGMLMRAVREHGVDLRSSLLIGNTVTDIEAARNAGIPSVLVEGGAISGDGVQPDWTFGNLREAVEAIVGKKLTAGASAPHDGAASLQWSGAT